MIGVFVGDENRGKRLGIAARGVESFESLLAGEAGVD
jgi:hypothetical protein